MIDYASQKSLTEINVRGGDNGCHVCLVLDGKSHGKSILVNLPQESFKEFRLKPP